MMSSVGESKPTVPAKAERLQPELRTAYPVFRRIGTRWADNDAYGHVNNVVYYSWFDTLVNSHLIEQGVLDIQSGPVIGLVIETQCNYFAPLAFPQTVEAGLRVAKLGQSSVRYEIGLFAEGSPRAAAQGHFVHVYVDRETRQPTPLPEALRQVLMALTRPLPLPVDEAKKDRPGLAALDG
ncbi:MAG: thioesterase superfamily protein [Rhodoferax sp.]|nr:thioesterase superfamily protein [Rhodoferax sp.]